MLSSNKKNWLIFSGIIVIAILAGLIVFPKGPDIRIGNYFREIKLHLGLDLQGGTHLVYDLDTSSLSQNEEKIAIEAVRDVIERRVNAFGITEPLVQTAKSGNQYRLIVELAGIKNIEEAIRMIGETPYLEFKELEMPEKESEFSEGKEVKFKSTGLSGRHLYRAQVIFDPTSGNPQIELGFNNEGEKLFGQITERNLKKPVAIFLDNQIISAPIVQDVIKTGKAVINGNFSLKEAKELAKRLNAGALPVPIKLVSQQNVEASLGKESAKKSLWAGIGGLFLVSLFMIFYYRYFGLLAVFALGFYALVVLAIFKLIPVILTLAGITGFILSIGMAIDANILIFERIKEERREDKNLPLAIERGFKRAWPSIRDSNIASLITCFILIWFTTSIVKGFAITLGIGILVSMFSAITVTRTFLRLKT